jgi:hypothetical protein
VTPGRLCVWALEKRRAGKRDQALRLLAAASALIADEAGQLRTGAAQNPAYVRGQEP